MSRFATTVLERMRQDGWDAVASSNLLGNTNEASDDESDHRSTPARPAARSLRPKGSQADTNDDAPHAGWAMWQKVVDATGSGMLGVANAVKSKVNADDQLCGQSFFALPSTNPSSLCCD